MADLVSDVQITETESDARPSKRTKHSASKTDSGATLAKIGVPPQQTLMDRMHDFMTTNDAANYLGVQLRDGANFKCITNLNGAAPKPGRSAPKVTKFMLQTKAGATEWAMVGRSLFPKCSAQQCSMPSHVHCGPLVAAEFFLCCCLSRTWSWQSGSGFVRIR